MTDYERGMNEAWEAARKICLDGESGGTSADELKEIFGFSGFYHDIMQNVSAAEAIEKIKAWEESEKIHIGDVVTYQTFKGRTIKGVVTAIKETEPDVVQIVETNGWCSRNSSEGLTKTGQTIDVQGFLKQIGESND